MESFGKRLQRLRKERNITQEEIANHLSISFQAVSKWENDITTPDMETLLKLSKYLNVSLNELYGVEEEHKITTSTKKFEELVLKVRVDSKNDDKVNINLPLAIAMPLLKSGNIKINGNSALEKLDIDLIIKCIESGLVGEIVSIEDKDGDKVKIFIE